MASQSQPSPPNVGQPIQPPYASTTVAHQPVGIIHVISNNDFDSCAKSMFCPYCQAKIVTDITYANGSLTWVASCLICCVGGAAGCCFIPFCFDMFKDTVHSCPNCSKELGVYKRL